MKEVDFKTKGSIRSESNSGAYSKDSKGFKGGFPFWVSNVIGDDIPCHIPLDRPVSTGGLRHDSPDKLWSWGGVHDQVVKTKGVGDEVFGTVGLQVYSRVSSSGSGLSIRVKKTLRLSF